MRHEKKWHRTSVLMTDVLDYMGSDYRHLCAILGVSRSFVDMILRGEKPLPAAHAYILGITHKVFAYERFVEAHLFDVRMIYVREGERHAKLGDPHHALLDHKIQK